MALCLHEIYLKEDQNDFIRALLLRLNGQEQFLISEIYIKNGAPDRVAKTLCMSRSNIYRLLQLALSHLLNLYNESCAAAACRRADRLLTELGPFLAESRPA